MNIFKISHLILALVSGFLLVGYGGMDDSPGAQGIGLLTVISSVFIAIQILIKKKVKNKKHPPFAPYVTAY